MSTKPASLPLWCTGRPAGIVEPTSDQKANGWYPNDEPPAEHVNWIFNLLGQWQTWIQAQAVAKNEANTMAPTVSGRGLMFTMDGGDSYGRKTRFFVTSYGALEITYGCAWNGSAWVWDHSADVFYKVQVQESGFVVWKYLGVGGNTWSDVSWSIVGTIDTDGLGASNATITTLAATTINNLAVPVAGGTVRAGVGGDNVPSKSAHTWGIHTPTIEGAVLLQFTLIDDLTNSDFFVTVTDSSQPAGRTLPPNYWPVLSHKDTAGGTTTVSIAWRDATGGTGFLNSGIWAADFMVWGTKA